MEIDLYDSLEIYKEKYFEDFAKLILNEKITFYVYLKKCKEVYDNETLKFKNIISKVTERILELKYSNDHNISFKDLAREAEMLFPLGVISEENFNLIKKNYELEKIENNETYKAMKSFIDELEVKRDTFLKISNFISAEIKTEENNIIRSQGTIKTEPTETPEFDFSNNEDKEKIIILEKLGIIDFIKSKQQKPETISHTAEILSAFTGINSDTLTSYLYPMLRPNRDDNDKNSPYKNPDNLLKANTTLHKLKIKNKDANR